MDDIIFQIMLVTSQAMYGAGRSWVLPWPGFSDLWQGIVVSIIKYPHFIVMLFGVTNNLRTIDRFSQEACVTETAQFPTNTVPQFIDQSLLMLY